VGEEQGDELRLVAVLLAGPLAQFVGVEEDLRPPTRLVVVVVGLLLLGLATIVVVALELLRLVVVVGRRCGGAWCPSLLLLLRFVSIGCSSRVSLYSRRFFWELARCYGHLSPQRFSSLPWAGKYTCGRAHRPACATY